MPPMSDAATAEPGQMPRLVRFVANALAAINDAASIENMCRNHQCMREAGARNR